MRQGLQLGQFIQDCLCSVPQLFLASVNIFQIDIVDSPTFMDTPCKLIQVVAGIPEQGNQFPQLR